MELMDTGLGVIVLIKQKIVRARSTTQWQTLLPKILIKKDVPLIQMGPAKVGPTNQALVDSHTSLMQRIFKKPVHLPTMLVADEWHIHMVDICHACPEGDRAL